MSIKIFHTADIQVNVGGRHFGRKLEYEHMLDKMSKHILDVKYDLVVVSGDVFERAAANETEKTLFVKHFVQPIVEAKLNLIVIDGNHDLKQSNFSFDPGDGSIEDEVNVLQSIAIQVNSPYLHYFDKTGFYNLNINGQSIVFAVWSHKAKYSSTNEPLNPWYVLANETPEKQQKLQELIANSIVIDLFHDPVKNCISFDGNLLRGDNEGRIDIGEFKGDFALLGDIHMPNVMRKDDRPNFFATYPSSPIIRFFDEGDYYNNLQIVQEGNTKHGFNFIEVKSKQDTSIEFIQLRQYATKHTIKINDELNIEDIATFELRNPGILNYVSIVTQSHQSIEVLDTLIKHLHSKYNCIVSTKTPAQQITQSNLTQAFDVSNLSNKDYLVTLANNCVSDKLAASKDDEEYKAQLHNDVIEIFKNSLEQIDYAIENTKFNFSKMRLRNFMPIEDIEIDFADIARLNNIVKINGNNGTGKTTIYKGISWLATGKIDWRQSDAKSKQNNLDYFNDKAFDKDEVYGELEIIDAKGDTITIKRTLKRSWQAKATNDDKKSKQWKSFVNKVDDVLQVYVNDKELDANDAAVLLEKMFGGFDKFHTLHIVNQASLDNMLLNMNINQLVDFILRNIGFTVVEQLQQIQDSTKAAMFKDLTKHAKDISGINIDISVANQTIEDHQKEIDANRASIAEVSANIDALQKQLNDEQSKQLFEDPAVDQTQKDNVIAQLSANQTQLANIQAKIDNPSWTAEKEAELVSAKAAIETVNNEISDKQAEVSKLNLERQEKQHSIELLRQQLTQAKIEAKSTLTAKQSKIVALQSDLQSQLNTACMQILDIVGTHISELNKNIDESANATADKRNKINEALVTINVKLEDAKQKLTKLETGVCSECERPFADSTKTQLQISELKSEIAKLESNKVTLENTVSQLNESVQERFAMPTTIESAVELAAKHNIDSQELTQLLNETKPSIEDKIDKTNDAASLVQSAIEQFEHEYKDDENVLTQIDTQTKLVSLLDLNISKANEALQNAVQSKQQAIEHAQNLEIAKQSEDVSLLYKSKDAINENNNVLQKQLDAINSKLIAVENNKNVKLVVDKLQSQINDYKTSQDAANNNISKLNISIETQKAKIAQYESIIDEIKAYEHQLVVYKLYQHLIGKNGLNKYVFDSVALQINSELNALLDELNFRIFFDLSDGYTIKMVDLLGNQSIRNLYTIGGMEGTLGSLSLLAIIKSKTAKSNGNFLFIDEITGKLNNSQDTKGSETTNKDYQFEFFSILKKLAQHTNIAIIDHVLDKSWFPAIIEIVKYDNGISRIAK